MEVTAAGCGDDCGAVASLSLPRLWQPALEEMVVNEAASETLRALAAAAVWQAKGAASVT